MSTSTFKAWTIDEIAREYQGGKLLLGFKDQVRLKRHRHRSRVYIHRGVESESESVSC